MITFTRKLRTWKKWEAKVMTALLVCNFNIFVRSFTTIPVTSKAKIPLKRISSTTLSQQSTKDVAIIGGGLAGLSVCYHLLLLQQQQNQQGNKQALNITIYDKESVPGKGGASAVAGGLIHPFSPKGKLVYLGIEGLECTQSMVQAAQTASDNKTIILRNGLIRVALTDAQVSQCQNTAMSHPQYATWKESIINSSNETTKDNPNNILGSLHLSNGCQVIHVPSYLAGLYEACTQLAISAAPCNKLQWCQDSSMGGTVVDDDGSPLQSKYDDIIYAAGSGLFPTKKNDESLFSRFPIQLVRGQSIYVPTTKTYRTQPPQEAFLCGKYVSPLPNTNEKMLVGSTHEYKEVPNSKEQVWEELETKTKPFAPFLDYDNISVSEDENWTMGVRVVSQRGANGRLPIIGKIPTSKSDTNEWIFTGLSSRGLLYHGIFGKLLSQAIFNDEKDDQIMSKYPELSWWKKKIEKVE